MKDIIIKVNTQTGLATCDINKIGSQNSNLQNKLKFELDTMINGIAWLEYDNGTNKNYAIMTQYAKGYEIDIKSVLLINPKLKVNLRITQTATPDGIPVFTSTIKEFDIPRTLDTTTQQPTQYPSWIDTANQKIQQAENLNITSERVADGVEITFTDKNGNTTIRKVNDGQGGRGTSNYENLTNKPKINNVELSGNKTLNDLGIDIPTTLAELTGDSTHRVVTDTEKITWNNKSNFSGNYNDLTNKPTIPTKTSDITNDSGFITNSVNDLINYYLKSETYTKQEVNNLIGQISTVRIEKVQQLPATGTANVIYLVPKEGTPGDVHNEYIYINNAWELIGNTQIDLTGYATETWVINNFLNQTQVNTLIATALTNYYTSSQVDTLLGGKVDKISGKSLSSNDYTTADKNKLNGIEAGAEVNDITDVQISGTSILNNKVANINSTNLSSIVRDIKPITSTTLPATAVVGTIYDLGSQSTVSINLPSGNLGDWLEVMFISGATATSLSITSSSGLSEFTNTIETNKIYTLFFEWINLDGTNYGWGISMKSYTKASA